MIDKMASLPPGEAPVFDRQEMDAPETAIELLCNNKVRAWRVRMYRLCYTMRVCFVLVKRDRALVQ